MSGSPPPPKRVRRTDLAPCSLDTPPSSPDAGLAELPPSSSLPVLAPSIEPDPVPPTLFRRIGIFRGDATIVLPVTMEVQLPMPVAALSPDFLDLAAYSAFALPGGALRPVDDAAYTVLDAYCQAHPPASVHELVLIETEFLRACQPLSEVALNLYQSLVRDRKDHSVIVASLMLPGRPIATLLALYNVPALLHLPLIRRVAIRLPIPELVHARWAFTGVLLTLPTSHAISLVRTYASFLADVRWVCPYALRSPNAAFWAVAVYSSPPAMGLHPYLSHVRTFNAASSTATLRALALWATSLGDRVFTRLRLFHDFLAVLHSLPNLADVLRIHPPADLADQAIADVLDWA